MCELLAVAGSAPVDVRLSLSTLAGHGGLDGHPDGWGGAFAGGNDTHVWRDPHAAAQNPWIDCLAHHPIRSELVIAHIRRATRGAMTLANTQPFVRELWGRTHTFAHNGDLDFHPRLDGTTSRRFCPIGETDSETAFCDFLDDVARTDGRTDAIQACFIDAVTRLRRIGPANILYASGGRLWAHADRRKQNSGAIEPPGLWLLERSCEADSDGLDASALSVHGSARKVVLLASVPLTNEPWRPLPRGTVLAIAGGTVVEMDVP